MGPEFVVADEPVSALDVSIQAQVLNLLADLREQLELTTVFIAHNLAVVRHIASRVAVMYLGQLVEVATRDEIFATPAHPYTRALLRAVPPPDPAAGWKGSTVALQGDMPSPLDPPRGCRFHTRCPEVIDICRQVVPEMQTWPGGRRVACHRANPPAATAGGGAQDRPADPGGGPDTNGERVGDP
jgi:oligopeptide/dipeptide ABC transporter ATP-binding protein